VIKVCKACKKQKNRNTKAKEVGAIEPGVEKKERDKPLLNQGQVYSAPRVEAETGKNRRNQTGSLGVQEIGTKNTAEKQEPREKKGGRRS